MTATQHLIIQALVEAGIEPKEVSLRQDDCVKFFHDGTQATVRYYPADDIFQVTKRGTDSSKLTLNVTDNRLENLGRYFV